MKRNAGLFLLLLVLLSLTYFFQEKRVEKEVRETQKKDLVLTQDITRIKTPIFEALKKDGAWWAGSQLLSFNVLNGIEKKIKNVRKIKDLEGGDWKSYFPYPITFEINQDVWTIGELTLDQQGFYLAIGKKVMVAVVEGESVELTSNENELHKIKLDELKAFLVRSAEETKEKQLFRFYKSIPSERVFIQADGNLGYELNFKKNTTTPPPLKGVSPHGRLLSNFQSVLTQINIKEEIPYDEKLKVEKVAEMTFSDEKDSLVWELWLRNKKSAETILIDPKTKRAFIMVGGTLRVFFLHVQDYWDKKAIPPKAFRPFTRVNAIFTQGTKSARVTVLNREPLAFEVQGHKTDSQKLNDLFFYIFNLGPKDQADRMSPLSPTEKQQVLSEDHLKISVFDQELIIWVKKEEIIVVNLTQGYKAHFHVIMENSRLSLEDMLK